jgi:hypothetical protein
MFAFLYLHLQPTDWLNREVTHLATATELQLSGAPVTQM